MWALRFITGIDAAQPHHNVKQAVEPSGWYFEYNNAFYPDVDDTCMALMVSSRQSG